MQTSPASFRVHVVIRWPRRHVRHTYNVPIAVAIAHKLKLNTTEHFTGLTSSPLSRKFSAIFHFPARERLFLDLSWSVNIKMFIGKAKTKLTFNNFSVITVVKSSVSTWDGYPVGDPMKSNMAEKQRLEWRAKHCKERVVCWLIRA